MSASSYRNDCDSRSCPAGDLSYLMHNISLLHFMTQTFLVPSILFRDMMLLPRENFTEPFARFGLLSACDFALCVQLVSDFTLKKGCHCLLTGYLPPLCRWTHRSNSICFAASRFSLDFPPIVASFVAYLSPRKVLSHWHCLACSCARSQASGVQYQCNSCSAAFEYGPYTTGRYICHRVCRFDFRSSDAGALYAPFL